jgi:hypothetical protein
LRDAGLNPYLLEMANIREQCSWVHRDRAEATAKAIELIRMSVARVRGNEALYPRGIPVERKALVIAGYGASTVARPMMALAGLASAALGGVQVIALKFLDRVGKGVRTSPRDALIGDSVGKEHRGLAFSFHRAMDHTGAVLGPAAAIAVLFFLLGPALWNEPAMQTRGRAVGDRLHRAAQRRQVTDPSLDLDVARHAAMVTGQGCAATHKRPDRRGSLAGRDPS